MNITELGAIGELVGGVAVIVSLIYVGLQVRQSTASSKASTEFAVQVEFNRLNQVVMTQPAMAEILTKVERSEALETVEAKQFRAYAAQLLATWVAVQQGYTHGAISKPYLERMKGDVTGTCEQYPVLAEIMDAAFRKYPAYRELEVFEEFRARA